MNLTNKWPFFVIGLFIGSLLVLFVFGWRKDINFPYLPEARVKHSLLNDSAVYESLPENLPRDTIRKWIRDSSIRFSKSEPRKKPCKKYVLFNENKNREFNLDYCTATNKILVYLLLDQ